MKIERSKPAGLIGCVLPVLVLAAALLPVSARAEESSAFDLDALIEDIERDLPGLHARLTRAEARELATRTLPRWYAPALRAELGGGGAVNAEESKAGPLARIVAEWTFWDGGRRAGRKSALDVRAALARAEVDLYRYDLRLSLARSILRLAQIAELRRINADESRGLLRLKNLLYARIRIGSLGYSEAAGIDLRRAELDDASTALAGEAERMRAELRILSGGSNPRLDALPAVFARGLPPAFAEPVDPENTPQLRLARLRARLGQAAVEIARRELYWPSLGLEVYGGYQPFRDALDPARPELGAQLTLRLPLFGAGRANALESARKDSAADRFAVEQTLRERRARLGRLKAELDETIARARQVDRLRGRARRNLALSFQEFAGGLKAPADMREALRSLYDFERRQAALYRRAQLLHFELGLPAALRAGPADAQREASASPGRAAGSAREEKQE